ncbi:surface protease GP63 [Trypanosoma cruzi Dm28c]|uniref:Surface protease GP63 n=1 Tax=Trypanosoma cruzi Dm28c TaxID=1416333 RepID=V5AYP5_TRYCR|nr:surface protease GP63 [Trypanosoma cruzi Dm28c]
MTEVRPCNNCDNSEGACVGKCADLTTTQENLSRRPCVRPHPCGVSSSTQRIAAKDDLLNSGLAAPDILLETGEGAQPNPQDLMGLPLAGAPSSVNSEEIRYRRFVVPRIVYRHKGGPVRECKTLGSCPLRDRIKERLHRLIQMSNAWHGNPHDHIKRLGHNVRSDGVIDDRKVHNRGGQGLQVNEPFESYVLGHREILRMATVQEQTLEEHRTVAVPRQSDIPYGRCAHVYPSARQA